MSSLTRDQILEKRKPVIERVPVPEWALNGTTEVCVRRFSAKAKMFLSESVGAAQKQGNQLPVNWFGLVCALAICDEEGNRLFSNPNDAEMLGDMDADVLYRVYDVAARLNGLSKDETEQITKNSEPSLSVVSSSP